MDTGAGEAQPSQLSPVEQVVTQDIVLQPRVLQLLEEHTSFLHQQGNIHSTIGSGCLHVHRACPVHCS